MKKLTRLVAVSLIAFSFFACSSYERIGSFTSVSTRNIESKADYVLLTKYTEVKVPAKKAKKQNVDPLTFAAEELVKKQPGGEFIKNAKFFRTKDGKTYKIEGDIWGYPMTPVQK